MELQEVGHSLHGRPLACYIHQGAGREELGVGKTENVVVRAAAQAEGAADDAVADVALPEYCAGCGIRMQTENPSLPG